MRRALAVIGLVVLGVVAGFFVRLLWPQRRLALDSYSTPVPDVLDDPGI